MIAGLAEMTILRWRLCQRPGWIPHPFERVIYRPPDGRGPRTALYVLAEPDGLHHLIYAPERVSAEGRDIFAAPGWEEERETVAMEQAEGEEGEVLSA